MTAPIEGTRRRHARPATGYCDRVTAPRRDTDRRGRWLSRWAKGSFPWRIGFVPLGTLFNGISTRGVLEPLRPGAPARWFNGFIQASHALEPPDFEALRAVFEASVRLENRLATA